MLVEWRLHAVVDLRGFEDLSVLCLVADAVDTEYAVSFHDLGAAENAVGGIGGVLVEVLLTGALVAYGLAGQRRLVDVEAHGFQQCAVGRYLGSGGKEDDVADDNVLLGHHRGVAVADDLHGLVVVDLVEDGKLASCLHLKEEGYARGKEDGYEYSHRLEEDLPGLVQPEVFIAGYADGQEPSYEQDDDERVGKFGEELPPEGYFLWRC